MIKGLIKTKISLDSETYNLIVCASFISDVTFSDFIRIACRSYIYSHCPQIVDNPAKILEVDDDIRKDL